MKTVTMRNYTLLKADTTKEQIVELCEAARKDDSESVCVTPLWVKTAAEKLAGSDVKVCTVIDFPLGTSTSSTKAFETMFAIKNGAQEVNMVPSIGMLKSGNDQAVEKDIRMVVDATHGEALVKVIIETSLLNEKEKERAIEISRRAGADIITGFSTNVI